MSNASIITSNDLIDDLVRRYFDVEPDVMAALAHGDEQVTLRRLPGAGPTTDPLDGLEVVVRRTLAIYLRMRRHKGAVALVSERQARKAGWPTSRLANTALILAWSLLITDLREEMPILLESDEDGRAAERLVRADEDLPSYETLLARLRQARWKDGVGVPSPERTRRSEPKPRPGRLVSLHDVAKAWLGVDAGFVELPADRWRPRETNGNARAAGLFAWVATEALDLGMVLDDERVPAVRLKTELDANLAGQPGAGASRFALLLGAAINHGAGTTVCFLPPSDDSSTALLAAGESIAGRRDETDDDLHARTVETLELKDLAARGYVHVGRRAAARVALRVYDACIHGPDVRQTSALDGDAP